MSRSSRKLRRYGNFLCYKFRYASILIYVGDDLAIEKCTNFFFVVYNKYIKCTCDENQLNLFFLLGYTISNQYFDRRRFHWFALFRTLFGHKQIMGSTYIGSFRISAVNIIIIIHIIKFI